MTRDGTEQRGEADEHTTLESRLQRLEQILARLEGGEEGLEAALELFEEGVRHVRGAETLLAAAELKVEELLAGGGTRPLDVAEDE